MESFFEKNVFYPRFLDNSRYPDPPDNISAQQKNFSDSPICHATSPKSSIKLPTLENNCQDSDLVDETGGK